ncbi:BA75_02134T0 [Komagataella pastoris]|uniref:asparaginase n=1 Tax=Komagataella pastoris TaxID=4922 RepID=A0A1B2JCY2_PICPA|nr:BA75_02134T0 [Komagataella pastoris]
MKVSTLLTIFTALVSYSSALPIEKRETEYNSSLPLVKIYGTGGTIASRGSSASQTSGYSLGLTVEDLIESVPTLQDVANLEYLQVSNVGSGSINDTILLDLAHNIQADLDEGKVGGAVVTHGTDSLEETSFFLELTVKTESPIVIVGAMRPATATSADGPMNLYQAVSVAGSELSKGRGSLVVFNDRIGSGFYSTKSSANALDTFKSLEQGYLGFFFNNDIEYYYPPARPNGYHYFNVTESTELPMVDIIYAHQSMDPALIYAAAESGVKGIVTAGMGAGSITAPARDALNDVYEKYGVITVQSRRMQEGKVPERANNFIGSGYLNPQKARIMLQLCLNEGLNLNQTKDVFSAVYGG